jgi:hypothetical protein
MSKTEFLELYGEAKVSFSFYYKYTFSFKGEFDGKSIYASVGGIADDIYKLNIIGGQEYLLKDLDFNYAEVTKCGITIAEFNDF